MVALNIRTVVVEVTQMSEVPRSRRYSAKDLLPWADPYIATLVQKVKAEILADHQRRQRCDRGHVVPQPRCEAPPPLPSDDVEFDSFRHDRDPRRPDA